jgi:hypothetical protein
MHAPLRNRFEICEAVDNAARNEIYRFGYQIYDLSIGQPPRLVGVPR